MATMILYIKGEIAHEIALDFTNMPSTEQRETHIDNLKEWLKTNYWKSLLITDRWEIIIEGSESRFNNSYEH